MRFSVKTLALALLLADTANATITMDHGQYHVHKPKAGVKDYKTGGPLTVHVLAHSHDDVGWLKTVDQYFDGSRKDIQWTNVEVEISSVVDALLENSARKFTQVEMKFFTMWWDKQTDERKQQVKGLVASGQLEMINGGWSMHDEACPIYDDMINNHMIGMEFLEKEFGVKPRIGWQVDPFGHSNTNARFFAEMGFDAWFFARLDYQDKNKRMNDKEMEFVWRPNPESLGNDTQIFTHAMPEHYCSPSGFGFDIFEEDFWLNDNNKDFNAEEKAQDLMKDIDFRAEHYLTDEVLVVWGCDFQFIDAQWDYRSLDNMIEYMNTHYSDKYHFQYATPSTYIDALQKHDVEWPTKTDDMFPYSDQPDAYWTGYFSSRANDKAYTRRASHYTHAQNKIAAEVCFAQEAEDSSVQDVLESKHTMLDVMGINQHHDAITGTAKQAVADDYAERIYDALNATAEAYSNLVEDRVNLMSGLEADQWTQCSQTNSSYLDCPVASWNATEGAQMTVAVQNPSSLDLSTAKIAVPHGHFKVQSFNPTSLQFEDATAEVLCYGDYVNTGETIESCFLHAVHATPAYDFSLLQLTYDSSVDIKVPTEELNIGATLENENFSLQFTGFSTVSNIQLELKDKLTKASDLVDIYLAYWPSKIRYTSFDQSQNSGDYIFRPIANLFEAFGYSNYTMNSTWSNGTNFQQMDFYFENADESTKDESPMKVILHVSLDSDLPVVQVDVDLGSLPKLHVDGYEMVAQFQVEGFKNQETFWTDSNGLEMQKRELNYRPTWDLVNTNYKDSFENITANYFPINSAISMRDGDRQFTVMNDRPEGGSALSEGKIELMQNRRIPADDSRGMGESLDEKDEYGNGIRVPATYYFQLFDKTARQSVQRLVQHKTDEPAQYFFSFNAAAGQQTPIPSTLSADLKAAGVSGNVKMNAFPVAANKILLRVYNLGDLYDEDKAQDVDIDAIANALAKQANRRVQTGEFNFLVEELALGANMSAGERDARKVHWKTVDDKATQEKKAQKVGTTVTLGPQMIKAYSVSISTTESFLQ